MAFSGRAESAALSPPEASPSNDHWRCEMRRRSGASRFSLIRLPATNAAEQRNEIAAFHSITSSARASSVGGISRPSALAVFRLTTNSNFTACWTGRSDGFAPFRIFPT